MTRRPALSFHRDLEFATETELVKRMGCSRPHWLRAVTKELADNAIDALEEAEVKNKSVDIEIKGREIRISDNGPGMPPEMVERLCVRSERTSAREAYAAPDRGSQGNALQTIMALGFGFGSDESQTDIISRGLKHAITLRLNRLEGRIDVHRVVTAVADRGGTTVVVHWKVDPSIEAILDIVEAHAWLNPHVTIRMAGHCKWQANTLVEKWQASEPTPPHWYTPQRFDHRILLELRRDSEITVGQFLSAFKGLSSTRKRAIVAERVGLAHQPLSALLDASGTSVDSARSRSLLTAMQAETTSPKAAKLGGVGERTFMSWLSSNPDNGDDGGDDDLTDYIEYDVDCNDEAPSDLVGNPDAQPEFASYTTIKGEVTDGIPYLWEIGFAHLPGADSRSLLIGQNFSPAIMPELATGSLGSIGYDLDNWSPVALFLHRISPARQPLEYGKSRFDVGYDEMRAVVAAIKKVAGPYLKKCEKEKKGQAYRPPSREKKLSIKDAFPLVVPHAYKHASSNGNYATSPRQIYYQARPKLLALTGQTEIGYGYFASNLLPKFIQDNPEVTRGWRVNYKPRGLLTEPHTNRKIPLGTAEVARYGLQWERRPLPIGHSIDISDWDAGTVGPHSRFGGLIIVEKEGIADLLIAAGIGAKFDVAIIGNEGQSVEAELKLADNIGVPIFVLHDFDRTGFTIMQNLRAGTWRHQYKGEVEVVEVGLRIDQVDGLERESITPKNRKSVSDDRLRECGATEKEIAFLHDERVELNAFTTEQLVVMVEQALKDRGIRKIIPAADELAVAWRSAQAHVEIKAKVGEIVNEARERWQGAGVPDDLADRLEELLDENPVQAWDQALLAIVENRDGAS